MNAGWGADVREALLRDKVLTKSDNWYYMDFERLRAVVGITPVRVAPHGMSDVTRRWLEDLISDGD